MRGKGKGTEEKMVEPLAVETALIGPNRLTMR